MILKGRVWKFGDDVDTDAIIPARYLNTSDPAELAKHLMEAADPEFPKKVKPGDVIFAGKNFGCGSSREHAPIAIKAAGVQAVVAKSFARIFFRNAFNIGLPIFESDQAEGAADEGDQVEIDAESGVVKNMTKGGEFSIKPIEKFMQELIAAGGLVQWTKRRMAASGGDK